jgi:hypothetical protein
VVGVGDAENDYAFLNVCECSVAVANALPGLKAQVDWVTRMENGGGVCEVIEELIANDLTRREDDWKRHRILLGSKGDPDEAWLSPRGPNMLVVGTSTTRRSLAASTFVERLCDKCYQVCVIDPDADCECVEHAITVGNAERGPDIEEIMNVLSTPRPNALVSLQALPMAQRRRFFDEMLPPLQRLRFETGRPDWLIINESQQLITAAGHATDANSWGRMERTVFVTSDTQLLPESVLKSVGTLLVVGTDPIASLDRFCRSLNLAVPPLAGLTPEDDEALVWPMSRGQQIYASKIARRGTDPHASTLNLAAGRAIQL